LVFDLLVLVFNCFFLDFFAGVDDEESLKSEEDDSLFLLLEDEVRGGLEELQSLSKELAGEKGDSRPLFTTSVVPYV
jgi:hypothetical protein